MMTFYRQNARWLLGGFLLACFSGFGQTFYISIWGAEIREEFHLTHGGFGIVYMIATLASAAVLPFVGRLVDVVSVSITSIIVIIMLALATVIMSQAESMVGLFSARFLNTKFPKDNNKSAFQEFIKKKNIKYIIAHKKLDISSCLDLKNIGDINFSAARRNFLIKKKTSKNYIFEVDNKC